MFYLIKLLCFAVLFYLFFPLRSSYSRSLHSHLDPPTSGVYIPTQILLQQEFTFPLRSSYSRGLHSHLDPPTAGAYILTNILLQQEFTFQLRSSYSRSLHSNLDPPTAGVYILNPFSELIKCLFPTTCRTNSGRFRSLILGIIKGFAVFIGTCLT